MGILVEMVKRHYAKKESRPGLYWCEVYKVRGINPETNRKKTVEIVAASNALAEQIQSKSGLLPPYEIENPHKSAVKLFLHLCHHHERDNDSSKQNAD